MDILFFTFRSTVTANKIDPRFPSTTLTLDFLLILPQNDAPIELTPATNLNSALSTPPETLIQTSASIPSVISMLTNVTEDVLKTMDETLLRQFIIDARKFTNPTPAGFCPIFVSVNNISQATKKPMPISINNSLPSINLHLGLLEDDENKMMMLVDTDAM